VFTNVRLASLLLTFVKTMSLGEFVIILTN
ncbi:MAG: hypothetical protein ACI81I_000700, partial [Arcobacteraceae bacterium]